MVIDYYGYEQIVKKSVFKYIDSFNGIEFLLDYYNENSPSLPSWRKLSIVEIYNQLKYCIFWDENLTKQIKKDVAEFFGRNYLDDEIKYFSEEEVESLLQAIKEVCLTTITKKELIIHKKYSKLFNIIIASFKNKTGDFLKEYAEKHNLEEQIYKAINNPITDIEYDDEIYDEGFEESLSIKPKHLQENYDVIDADPYVLYISRLEIENIKPVLTYIDSDTMSVYFSSDIVEKYYNYYCYGGQGVSYWEIGSIQAYPNPKKPLLIKGSIAGNISIPTKYISKDLIKSLQHIKGESIDCHPSDFREEINLIKNSKEIKDIIGNLRFDVKGTFSKNQLYYPVYSSMTLDISYVSAKQGNSNIKNTWNLIARLKFDEEGLKELNDSVYTECKKLLISSDVDEDDEEYDEGFEESLNKIRTLKESYNFSTNRTWDYEDYKKLIFLAVDTYFSCTTKTDFQLEYNVFVEDREGAEDLIKKLIIRVGYGSLNEFIEDGIARLWGRTDNYGHIDEDADFSEREKESLIQAFKQFKQESKELNIPFELESFLRNERYDYLLYDLIAIIKQFNNYREYITSKVKEKFSEEWNNIDVNIDDEEYDEGFDS